MRRSWLWIILIAALALRTVPLIFAWRDRGRFFTPDSAGYWSLAEGMSADSRFYQDDRPEIFRPPGYPALLAAGITLQGGAARWGGPDGAVKALIVLQILLDVLLVWVTYALGKRLLSRQAGLIAAGFQAISPLVVASSCRILSDGVYALLLTVSVMLMVRHLQSRRWSDLVWSALVLGAACYVRPLAQVTAAIFAVVLLFGPRRLARTGAFAAIFAACMAPWILRNAVTADYRGFSCNATDSMYYFAAPKMVARSRGISDADARARLKADADERATSGGLTPGQAARWRKEKALEILGEDPWAYLKIHLAYASGFWLPGAADLLELCGLTTGQRGTVDVLQSEGLVAAARHYFGGSITAMLVAAAMVLILLAKYLCVLACVVCGVRLRPSAGVCAIAAVIVISALLPGPSGVPRYRIPVEPLLNVAAAVGVLLLLRARRGDPTGHEAHRPDH